MHVSFPEHLNADQRQEYLLSQVFKNQAMLQTLLAREGIRDAWERGITAEQGVDSVFKEYKIMQAAIEGRSDWADA